MRSKVGLGGEICLEPRLVRVCALLLGKGKQQWSRRRLAVGPTNPLAVVDCWQCLHYSTPNEQITFLKVLFAWHNCMCTRALGSVLHGTLGKEGWNLFFFFVWVVLVGFFYIGKSIATIAKFLRVAQASLSEEI